MFRRMFCPKDDMNIYLHMTAKKSFLQICITLTLPSSPSSINMISFSLTSSEASGELGL